jgi:hypothetical protein
VPVACCPVSDVLVWMDLEMTGLDVEKDVVVEIAVLATSAATLEPLDDGFTVVVAQPAEVLAGMSDFVRQMHQRSGLLAEIEAGGIPLEDAGRKALEYIKGHVPTPRTVPLCGTSIGTCPRSRSISTTARSTCRRSRSSAGGGTGSRSSPARRRPTTTGRCPTSGRPLPNCGTTGRRSSNDGRYPMMGGLGGVRVGSITVDCEDPHRLGGFWSALLGVAVVEVGEDYAELAKLSEDGPNLLFIQVPESKAGKNRLHLDLVVADVKSAVDSAMDLGARRAEDDLAGPFPWTVMLDPEGNEFCLCPPDCPGPSAEEHP